MCVYDCIVGMVISIKKTESLTDLESLYGTLNQQAFKGEPDLSRVQQDVRQLEGGRSK